MTKQLEALIARAKHIVENGGLLARDTSLALIAALEQAQQSEEVAELLRDKVKRLESDIWDSQQLVKVKSENQYELECKVRELKEYNDKSNLAWSRREDAALEKLDAAEKRIAELESSETQLICERDNAEEALADMYQAATGERPEWSNFFSFSDAVDAVEQRLGELEASPLAVKLPDRKDTRFWAGDAFEFDTLGYVMAVEEAIRAAGGTVEGE